MNDLLLESYNYQLPEELIAQYPCEERDQSRLMIYDEGTDEIMHTSFGELPLFLGAKDCLVFNQSKVFPCRFHAQKESGGRAEIFILSLKPENDLYPALIKSNSKKKFGDKFQVKDEVFEVVDMTHDNLFLLKFSGDLPEFVYEEGRVPLPHYMKREDNIADRDRYQTVFANQVGSVAAPTAGLHFSDEMLKRIQNPKAFVTLHVGLGTFRPVTAQSITDHKMHSENYLIDLKNLDVINKHQKNLIAVGTTALRTLESSLIKSGFRGGKWDETDIFIHPGKEVSSIQGLVTNFHLPKSSLLMLVSSLIGREKTLRLYEEAVKKQYRFFSYGDAMYIRRKSAAV